MKYLAGKSTLIGITLTMFSAILVILILYYISSQASKLPSGFKRTLLTSEPALQSVTEKNEDVTAIVGKTKDHLYFQTIHPQKLLRTDIDLKNPAFVNLNVIENDLTSAAFSTIVDSPLIHVMTGNTRSVYQGALNTNLTREYRVPDSIPFTRAVSISPSTYVLRGHVKLKDQVFLKVNVQNGERLDEKNISEKNGDGGLATDGLLHYDSSTHLLTYVYFYGNQTLCLDTNLQLVYKGRTIDNTFDVQTEAAAVSNGKLTEYTNVAPSRIVNWESCVDNGKLYNNSMLQADNENPEAAASKSVIDVYDIKSGKYLSSFYLPRQNKEKLMRFKVFGDLLVAVYQHSIATYQLH